MTTQKKYALVLSGGGFKGAYQLGAIRYIRESWNQIFSNTTPMQFDIVAGVSVGALNGAMIASKQYAELDNLWNDVKQNGSKEIYESGYIDNTGKIKLSFRQLKQSLLPNFKVNAGLITKGVWNSFRSIFSSKVPGLVDTLLDAAEKEFEENFPKFKALANNKPLEKKLQQYIDLRNIPEATLYMCGLVSINDGLYYSLNNRNFNSNSDFIQAILASSAMPIIWEPVATIDTIPFGEINNAVDGGIRNISPLGDVVNSINADLEDVDYEVIIINCNSGNITPLDRQWNIGDIALRTLSEITLAEVFNNDIEEFLKINAFVTQAAEGNISLRYKNKKLRRFSYTLIQPQADELGDILDSTKDMLEKREQFGYEDAKKAFAPLYFAGSNTPRP